MATRRVRILVKAYPQPSSKYEETVCCAGIDEDSRELLRLFPIRYRRLSPENRFDRFDQVEMSMERYTQDPRPESYHVDEDSIRVTAKGDTLSARSRVQLWVPFVADSLSALQDENRSTNRSLGIVRPDSGSVQFKVKRIDESDDNDRELANEVYEQASLLEDPLKPLPRPEYNFVYHFKSAGKQHVCTIHDWEVQQTFIGYRRKYGDEAIGRVIEMYQDVIPTHNLHLIMGTMQKRPWQFIIIGLLRSKGISPEDLTRQPDLF